MFFCKLYNVDTCKILKFIAAPRQEGRNIVVQLDFDDYIRGVKELQYSLVGRLSIQRGEVLPTNMNRKVKIEASWGSNNFRVITLKGIVYNFLLNSPHDHSRVMTQKAINMKPCVLRVSR